MLTLFCIIAFIIVTSDLGLKWLLLLLMGTTQLLGWLVQGLCHTAVFLMDTLQGIAACFERTKPQARQ